MQRQRRLMRLFTAVGALSAALATSAHADDLPLRYSVTLLAQESGEIEARLANPYAINALGVATGHVEYLQDGGPDRHAAAVWRDGALDIEMPPNELNARGLDINATDVIVGATGNSSIGFRWDANGLAILTTGKYMMRAATGINDDGVIVGSARPVMAPAVALPARWIDDGPEFLALPESFVAGYPQAINASGTIAGYVTETLQFNSPRAAVVWHGNEIELLPVPPGEDRAEAHALNEAGDVIVGRYRSSKTNRERACRWVRDDVTQTWTIQDLVLDLPSIESHINNTATAINADGDILISVEPARRAYLWRDGAVSLIDDNTIASTTQFLLLYEIVDLNDAGQLLVEVFNPVIGSDPIAAILTPLPPCAADLDDSGAVDFADMVRLLDAWGTIGPGDLDEDGSVGTSDLILLLAAWGPCRAVRA